MVDVDVRFNVGEDQPVNADFEIQPDVMFTADIEVEPIKDHNRLNNRDLPDQHPISAIAGLEDALNNESQAIADLDNKIEIETARAEEAESILDTKIETEKMRATNAEDVLQDNIDAEETRAKAAEMANATAISNEENRAIQAESDLNTAIQAETNRAESVESALSGAISAETTRAEEAESTLQTNINNESSRAQQAETNLSTAISYETTRAETAESGLSADISAEVTARQNADTALQTSINTEIANRTNADNALGTRIDNEISAREGADDTLQDNIDSEASTRESEITRVEGLISAEITRATNAEQANATSISNHIADKNNPHEVSKSQVGLGNVDNTSDVNKPISTATRTALNAIGDEIDTINSKIPTQASSTNQLADKDFVNSSISSNAAYFIGTFNSVSELNSYSGTVTNNDYAFVVNGVVTDNGNDWSTFSSLNSYDKSLLTNFDYAWVINGSNFDLYRFDIVNQVWDLRAENIEKDDVSLNAAYNRYKAIVSGVVTWIYEYTLNNSSFTAAQWEAINSTATQDKIVQIAINTGNITTLSQTKQNNITFSNMLDADLVDDSTSTNKFVTSADITNWNAKQNAISDLETIRSGAALGATSVQSITQGTANGTINVDGSDVAVKGLGSAAYTNSASYDAAGSASQAETNAKNYADSLSTNYATATQGIKADTAVQPSDLATVATSGSYVDLSNKPTIGNAALTIQKNGTIVDTFTANSTVDKIVNITVPTNNNQLTNGAGYQTASDVATAISGKQDTLVSGTNIKTINSNSILGSGNLDINGLPTQTGQSGKFLTTDGTDASWADVDALPSQTGQSGKYLTTDGSSASWATLSVNPDNKSITTNSSDELQTVGVINSRDGSTAIKTWTGTKAQFDAIVTKDPNTLYEVTDDYNVTEIRALGQIVQSTIPLVDAGLHLLDGSVIAYGSYKAFVDYMAGLVTDYPDLFTTEANWQTSVTNYGVCGKFVYNSTNNTVRLPKYNSKIYTGGGTAGVKGNGMTLGLTDGNINYGLNIQNASDGRLVPWGNSYGTSVGSTAYNGRNAGSSTGITLDPTKSGIITDLSTITTALDGYWYICVATYPKTQIEVDIDEIATDLNGKADTDLSNMNPTQTVKNTIVGWGMPDYSAGVELDINTPSPFDAYWYGYHNNHYCSWTIELPTGGTITLAATLASGLASSCWMLIPKGSYYTYAYNNWKPVLYPLKGVN